MSNFCTSVKSSRRRAALLGWLVAISTISKALATPTQPARPAQPAMALSVEEAVGGLVYDALTANLELDGASAGVAQRLAALDQARALYLPSLDFSARYTRASGGRTIQFPVGDLLNPVYATLNQITLSASFPAGQNQQINFQRPRGQDTPGSLRQPLYDPRLSALGL